MRAKEVAPGQAAEVWVHDRGAAEATLRATIVMEDLRGVLTSIASPSGASGPNNPVTQYILANAAAHLADRILGTSEPQPQGDETVPRILSRSLGHIPFIESVLNMSPHQMLRRWPTANGWYTDVVRYVLRPWRYTSTADEVLRQMDAWNDMSLAEFMLRMADLIFRVDADPGVVRVADAIRAVWPDYPPVREALTQFEREVVPKWVTLYGEIVRRYGLQVRPEFSLEDIGWAFHALREREAYGQLGGHWESGGGQPETGFGVTMRVGGMILTGALIDSHGRSLSPIELLTRMPVTSAAHA